MLKGISPLVGPDLLALLCRMGHGDEIVLADAHFPGESVGRRVVRADGCGSPILLDAILPLLELDGKGGSPMVMMAADGKDVLDPTVEDSYRRVILRHCPGAPPSRETSDSPFTSEPGRPLRLVMTGETAKYGNIILRKGVTPCEPRTIPTDS